MQALRLKNDSLIRQVNSLSMDARCRGNGLESFLILPVQRIPRYKMLFAEVVKLSSNDHADFEDLQNALQQASAVATQINEGKFSTGIHINYYHQHHE